MPKKFAGLLAACLLTTAAWAEPASDASVQQLLELSQVRKVVDALGPQMEAMMRQSMQAAVQGRTLTPQQQRVLDGMTTRMSAIARDEMRWEQFEPMHRQIYRETFTQDEVDGLIAFYRSPAGQAYIAKQPLLMQKSMAVTQQRLGPMMEKMNAAIEAEMREAGLTPPAPRGRPATPPPAAQPAPASSFAAPAHADVG